MEFFREGTAALRGVGAQSKGEQRATNSEDDSRPGGRSMAVHGSSVSPLRRARPGMVGGKTSAGDGGSGQGRSFPPGLLQKEDAEDGHFRLNGVAVARHRKDDVVRCGKKQNQPEQKPGTRFAKAQRASKPP